MLICGGEGESRYVSENVVDHVQTEVFTIYLFDVDGMVLLSGLWTKTRTKGSDSSILLILAKRQVKMMRVGLEY